MWVVMVKGPQNSCCYCGIDVMHTSAATSKV